MARRLFSFVGGSTGDWQVTRLERVTGDALESVSRVDVVEGEVSAAQAAWALRGVTSYERYVTKAEQMALTAIQPPLGRPQATCVAMIPIRKSAAWWALPQDERRAVLEERSHHIQLGLQYLPAIARRLHHSYELGEPFDFVTWLEYAPADAAAFEQLLDKLRQTEEWRYIDREVDIRLIRAE